jgi:hypothetical protein
VEQMKLVNALCRFAEVADEQALKGDDHGGT